MPELPEVETLRRALLPLVKNKACSEVKLFRKTLRFPIPEKSLVKGLVNHKVSAITRKGKYLLFQTPEGSMLLHLGMSGRIVLQQTFEPLEKHTHVFLEHVFCGFSDL